MDSDSELQVCVLDFADFFTIATGNKLCSYLPPELVAHTDVSLQLYGHYTVF